MLFNELFIDKSRDLEIPSHSTKIALRYARKRLNLPHCSNNSTKVLLLLYCWKCIEAKNRGRNRRWKSCRSLFRHLTIYHNGSDKTAYPSNDDCILMLQCISDAVSIGVLK